MLEELGENPWKDKDKASKVNSYAPKTPAAGAGAFVIGEVKAVAKDPSGTIVILQLVGADKFVFIRTKSEPSDFPAGGNWVVVGRYGSGRGKVKLPPDNTEAEPVEISSSLTVSVDF